MDREVFRIRDMISAKFADAVYNGFWFSPEMEFMLSCIKENQKRVSGVTTVQLYKGRESIAARASPFSLYDQDMSSMDKQGGYNPEDAAGFININSIRLKAHAMRENKNKK